MCVFEIRVFEEKPQLKTRKNRNENGKCLTTITIISLGPFLSQINKQTKPNGNKNKVRILKVTENCFYHHYPH